MANVNFIYYGMWGITYARQVILLFLPEIGSRVALTVLKLESPGDSLSLYGKVRLHYPFLLLCGEHKVFAPTELKETRNFKHPGLLCQRESCIICFFRRLGIGGDKYPGNP